MAVDKAKQGLLSQSFVVAKYIRSRRTPSSAQQSVAAMVLRVSIIAYRLSRILNSLLDMTCYANKMCRPLRRIRLAASSVLGKTLWA